MVVYNYDESAADKKGQRISSGLYQVDTSTAQTIDGNNRVSSIIFKVPDETPLVIEYTYDIQYSSKMADPTVQISNAISLDGTS